MNTRIPFSGKKSILNGNQSETSVFTAVISTPNSYSSNSTQVATILTRRCNMALKILNICSTHSSVFYEGCIPFVYFKWIWHRTKCENEVFVNFMPYDFALATHSSMEHTMVRKIQIMISIGTNTHRKTTMNKCASLIS